jgi:multidrug efflux pump subunit AcrA (membrane-fusion protein)
VPDQALTGRVAAVVPQADVRSRTFPVKVRVENKISESSEPLLKAGMFARVTLATGAKTRAILVPKDALVLGGPQPMIWLIDPSSVSTAEGGRMQGGAVAVSVRLGVADGELIQVEGAIPEGNLVVFKGNERIIPSRTGEPSPVVWAARSGGVGGSDGVKAQSEGGNDVAD